MTSEPVDRLVTATGAEKTIIERQLQKLTSYGIAVPDAARTIETLYGGDDPSAEIFDLRGVGSLRGHFLLDAGYDSIEKIAVSSVAALEEVRYLGEQSAPIIHESAVNEIEADTSDDDTEQNLTPAIDEASLEPTPESDRLRRLLDRSTIPSTPTIHPGVYPPQMVETAQWLVWKEEDGRKIPRAPWYHGDLRYVNAHDDRYWVSFEEAREWADHLTGTEVAFVLTDDDPFLFVDLDDVRDPDTGRIDPPIRVYLKAANTYTAMCTSGTGLHLFCQASLSPEVKAITDDIRGDSEGHIEVYDRDRFIAVTGSHLGETPTDIRPGEGFVDAIEKFHVTVSRPAKHVRQPKRDPADIEALESTDDIEDIFDAIAMITPGDIRLKSERTEVRGDGTISYDPSWAPSESGTRLAGLHDGWVYREGMISLDAIQVVALEEGIIDSELDFPTGKSFWDAVESLRERGAHIPEFENTR